MTDETAAAAMTWRTASLGAKIVVAMTIVAALVAPVPMTANPLAPLPPAGAQIDDLLTPPGGEGTDFGFAVAAEGIWAVVGDPTGTSSVGTGTGVAHLYRYDEDLREWTFAQTLEPPDLQPGDEFGFAVATDGQRIVIGAPGTDGRGAAYRYTRRGVTWALVDQRYDPPNGSDDDGDRYGHAVGVGLGTFAIGQPGSELPGDPIDDLGRVYGYDGFDLEATLVGDASAPGFGNRIDANQPWMVVASAPGPDPAVVAVHLMSRADWPQSYRTTVPSGPTDPVSVAVEATQGRVAIGLPESPGGGSVEIHRFAGLPSGLVQTITAPDASNEAFGTSVSIDQHLLAVGDPLADTGPDPTDIDAGRVSVFQGDRDTFVSSDEFTANDGPAGNVGYGFSVTTTNTEMFAGAPDAATNGTVSRHELTFREPVLANKLLPLGDDEDDGRFGTAVAADGEWAVIGSPGTQATLGGRLRQTTVEVYRRGPAGWEPYQALESPTPQPGFNNYGSAVAIFDRVMAVADSSSSVDVWRRGADDVWVLDQADVVTMPMFGGAGLDLDRIVLAVGGQNQARVLIYDGTSWNEHPESPIVPAGLDVGDEFGFSVAYSFPTLAIGASGDDGPGAVASGTVHLYELSSTALTPLDVLSHPDGELSTRFGRSVDVHEDRLAVGAILDDVDGIGNAGAVHVYNRNGDTWTYSTTLGEGIGLGGANLGRSVDLTAELLLAGARTGNGADTQTGGAVYWRRIGSGWSAPTVLTAEDGQRGDQLGLSSAIGGTEALVGADRDDNPAGIDAGAVYTFPLPVSQPPNRVLAAEGETGAFFGEGLDIDGDWAIAGSWGDQPGWRGSAEILQRQGDSWVSTQTIRPRNSNGARFEVYGYGVSIEGDTIAIGTRSEDALGYVEIYRRPAPGQDFAYVTTITSPTQVPGDRFGLSVELDDGRLAVGNFPNEPAPGSAYIFETSDGWASFTEHQLALPPTGEAQFGEVVALQGDDLFVIDKEFERTVFREGVVHHYRRQAVDDWSYQQTITTTRPRTSGFFGLDMVVDGDVVAIGALGSDTVELFRFDDTTHEFIQLIDGPQTDGDFGYRLALSDGLLAVASQSDVDGVRLAGRVDVYRSTDSGWVPEAALTSPIPQYLGGFGNDVAIEAGRLLVGARLEDTPKGAQSGAVYHYEFSAPDEPAFTSFDLAATGDGTSTAAASVAFADLATVASSVRGAGEDGSLAAAPIGSIGPDGEQPGAIERLNETTTLNQLEALAQARVPLSEIPLETSEGMTWEDVLVGSPFAGRPLQTVTLADVFSVADELAIPLGELKLASLNLAASPLNTIPLVAVALAGVPLNTIDLSEDQWCEALAGTPLDCGSGFLERLRDGSARLLDVTLAGVPLNTIPLNTIPLNTIDFESIELRESPLNTIPLNTIDLAASPLNTIPLNTIEIAESPLNTIPLNTIPLNTIPLNTIVLDAVLVQELPLNTIPLNTIDLAASPLNTIPLNTIPLNTIPLNTIRLRDLDLDVIPLNTIPLNTIPLNTISLSDIPLNTIDLGRTGLARAPLNTIPLNTIPLNTIPLNTIPLNTIPLNTIPLNTIPVTTIEGSPLNTIPLNTIDLARSPLNTIPLNTIATDVIDQLVDCSIVNCLSADLTLGDAARTGAIGDGVTLDQLPSSLLALISFQDLIDAGQVDDEAIDGWARSESLELIRDSADLTLGDLPDSVLAQLRLGQLGEALELITWEELMVGRGVTAEDRTVLEERLDTELGDDRLTEDLFGQLTLGDVIELLPADATVGNLGEALAGLRLRSLVDLLVDPADVDLVVDAIAGLLLGTVDGGDEDFWQDVTLGDIAQGLRDEHQLGPVLAQVADEILALLTLGDLLAGIVGLSAYPWETLETETLAAAGAGEPVGYEVTLSVGGTTRTRPIDVAVTLPLGARYRPSSGRLIGPDGEPGEPLAPTSSGSNLLFTVPEPIADTDYRITFEVIPTLTVGTASTTASASIVGTTVSADASAELTIRELQDPGDTPGTALVIDDQDLDSILLQRISSPDDVDLYAIDVGGNGARLSAILSNLPQDYDLVLYGPPPATILPPNRYAEDLVDDQGIDLADGQAALDSEPADDQPNSLQGRPVIARSASRAEATDRFDTGPLPEGRYHVQVSGYNGASSPAPYALRVNRDDLAGPPVCAGPGAYASGPTSDPTVPAGTTTLFLVNAPRLEQVYAGEGQQLAATIRTAAGAFPGVSAAVVPIDQDPSVAEAYRRWLTGDAFCDPTASNRVAGTVNALVRRLQSEVPTIEHVVIVGGDDIIPFARVADRTTLANEADYRTGFAGADTPILGSLDRGYLLTDEVYGDTDPRGFDESRTFYLSDLALGRLVETPAQIEEQLTRFAGAGGRLAPSTGYVAAYDFLSDGGADILATLDRFAGDADHPVASTSNRLDDLWSRQDLADGIDGALAQGPIVGSVNAHFDHYRALPALGDTTGDQSDLYTVPNLVGANPAGLATSLLFSMGCHSGLSVPDGLHEGEDFRTDWAQAATATGGVWIGNTGYAYGDTEANLYTERLMTLFTERLDGSVDAGEALLYAKQAYAADLAQTGVYDAKVLMISTFYGLPFFKLDLGGDRPTGPPLPEPPTLDQDPIVGLERDTIEVAPVLVPETVDDDNRDGTYWFVEQTDTASGETTENTEALHYRPIQPRSEHEVTINDESTGPSLDLVAHGGLVTSLTSIDYVDIDPLLVRPTFDLADNEPEPQFGQVLFPAEPLDINTYLTPEGERQNLVVVAGQFRSEADAETGIQRLYESADVEVYYAPPTEDDYVSPIIEEVTATATDGAISLNVDVADLDGTGGPGSVRRVYALIAEDPATCRLGETCQPTTWTGVDLALTTGGRWTGTVPVSGVSDTTKVEYLIQAVDAAGNIGVTANKARNFEATKPPTDEATGFDLAVRGRQRNGWYVSDVTIEVVDVDDPNTTFTWELLGSGQPRQPYPEGGIVLTEDGVLTVAVVGRAPSGAEEIEVVTVRRDRTGPTIVVGPPESKAIYQSTDEINLAFDCLDAGSGPGSCDATIDGQPVAEGASLTDRIGRRSLRIKGRDSAGNTSVRVVGWQVRQGGVCSGDDLTINGRLSPPAALPVRTTTLRGWDISGGHIELVAGPPRDRRPQWARLDTGTNTTLGQVIQTIPGETYRIEFWFRRDLGSPPASSNGELLWDGQPIANSSQITSSSSVKVAVEAVATSTSSTIEFRATGTADGQSGQVGDIAVRCRPGG